MVPGEALYAVYDCKGAGTGFIGITDRRIIFYDKRFMRKIKAKAKVTSVCRPCSECQLSAGGRSIIALLVRKRGKRVLGSTVIGPQRGCAVLVHSR